MNSSKMIYEGLMKNSDEIFVAEFLQKIFKRIKVYISGMKYMID